MIAYGSVCSGIEAASVAWSELGWQASWLSEIEKFPSAVLSHHYPSVKNLGDMTLIPEMVSNQEIEVPDILVGGTPCQAFSLAGLRGGLSDERGALTIKFVELANAIDDARRARQEPESIIIWENVPGVLSSKDNAFGCFLGALAGEDCELQPAGKKWPNAGCVFGPQRAIAWRVLDAQYFGVAQRRRRVFLIASTRDGFNPAEILFERDGLRRDIAPSREPGQEANGDFSTSAGGSGSVVGALCARDFKGVGNQCVSGGKLIVNKTYQAVSHCLNAGGMGRQDYETESFVITNSFGIPGNWIGRKPENGGNAVEPMVNIAPCLTSTDRHGVLPLNSMMMMGRPSDDLNPRMGLGIGKPGDPQNTLSCNHHHAVAILNGQPTVRRLTPIECERLQGFPDFYTQIPWRGKDASECPDGPRYKALGNSMAVPVMRWIGERVKKYLEGSL